MAAPISTGEFNKSGKLAKSITFFYSDKLDNLKPVWLGDSVVPAVSIFKYFQLQPKSWGG